MKNKYNINELVYDCSSRELKTIKDYESFDDFILYYFKKGGASPEKKIINSRFYMVRKIISTPDSIKVSQINKVLANIDNELKQIL